MSAHDVQAATPFDPQPFLTYREKCSCARANTADLIVTESLYTIDSVDRYLRLARTRREARICFHTVSEYDNRKATLAVMPPAVADDPEQLALVVQAVLARNGDPGQSHAIIDIAPSFLYLGDALDEGRLKRAFVAGVTLEDGGRLDDEWWASATARWRESVRQAADPNSTVNRFANIADLLRDAPCDEHGLALLPLPVDQTLARSAWLCDLCSWEKAHAKGTATVLPVHSGVWFLLVVDIQHAARNVCVAVALLSHDDGMNLPHLARLLREWFLRAWLPVELLPQSAEEVVPGVISRERIDEAFRRPVVKR
jgi:hypothetical protein